MTPQTSTHKPLYSGWKNRQTWNVMLWLDNDEGAYRYYQERVRAYREAHPNRTRLAGIAAKSIAKDAIGDSTPDGISLNSNRIDWPAIGAAMMEV